MSIFASQTQDTRPVPFDAGQTVVIRKLTGREYEQAQQLAASELVTQTRVRGFAQKLRRVMDGSATDADAAAALRDPLVGFDRLAIIRAGLVSWSYPLPDGHTRDQQIDDLDDDAAEWLAREILQLTKPELFAEDARKNG